MPKYPILKAEEEREEDLKILCQSCGAAAIDDGPYCQICKEYWESDDEF